MATCYRHPGRETGVSCSNCARPICPDCMTPTSVGMRCPECARQKTKVHTVRTMTSEPRVTYALIAVNVLLFIAGGGGSGGSLGRNYALLGNGTFDGVHLVGVAHGQWWRLVSGGFLHENILHIGFNMYLLYMLGRMLEPVMGSVRFGALYFAALLAGSFGALVTTPQGLTVGASGAIFGLMGATFLEFRARGIDPFAGGIMGSIGGLIVINLVFSFAFSGISIGGHIGGLIGGGLAAWLIHQSERRRLPSYVPLLICAVVAAASVAGAFAVAGGSGLSL